MKALEQYVFDNVGSSNYDVENLLTFKNKLEELIKEENASQLNKPNAGPGVSGTITTTVTSDSATTSPRLTVSDPSTATDTGSVTIEKTAEVSESDSSKASDEQALSNPQQTQSDDQSSSRSQ